MSFDFKQLDVIDLISERHIKLRKITEKRWNDLNDVYISKSEWFILARIYQKGQTSISFISNSVDITRQATHKFIKGLKEKGLVKVGGLPNNKKEKSIEMTSFGKECYQKNEQLKAEVIKEIADEIGQEKMELLKEILKKDWGM